MTNICVKCPLIILILEIGLLGFACVFAYLSGHFEIKTNVHYRENYAWGNDAMLEWDMQQAARIDSLRSQDDLTAEIPPQLQLLDQMTA